MKERPRVVILGGGIGGIKAAQKLANQPVDVLIIDHNNYQVFQPLLYQVATSMLSTDEVVYPIRGFFKKRIMLISFSRSPWHPAKRKDRQDESRGCSLRLSHHRSWLDAKFLRQ